MPEYRYEAKTKFGGTEVGTVIAGNSGAAAQILQEHGLVPIRVRVVQHIPFLEKLPFLHGKVSPKELVLFTRQLATLVGARVPIVQSLRILEQQVAGGRLKRVVNEIATDVEAGASLSESLEPYANIFSPLYIQLARSGEISGNLDDVLQYLADQQERSFEIRGKVRSALTYPIFILGTIVVVGIVMFVFVIPRLVAVLQESGAELPLTTRILIAITNFSQQYWWVLLAALLLLAVGVRILLASESGHVFFDTVKLRVPLLRPLLQKLYLARMSRNLATLLQGGLGVVQALEISAGATGNAVYRVFLRDAARKVQIGQSFAQALQAYREMPPMVVQMIAIGEKTGTLSTLLEKAAVFYEKELDQNLDTLTSLLQPIVLLLLGVAVAIMVAGILLPIYNLASIQ
jgi:type IV pilus assembly protein PilC